MDRKHFSYRGYQGYVEDTRKATRDDWTALDMPERYLETTLDRVLTEEELWNIGWGHIPAELEDRWFMYVEDGWAYMHRSWTGICVFILELGEGPLHKLYINNDPEQYTGDLEHSTEQVNSLLDYWGATFTEKGRGRSHLLIQLPEIPLLSVRLPQRLHVLAMRLHLEILIPTLRVHRTEQLRRQVVVPTIPV